MRKLKTLKKKKFKKNLPVEIPSNEIKTTSNKNSTIKITACYIVKNEAKRLPRSIESLKNSVDEIIVVDTGSTDNTIAIAKKYGAKVIETPWKNDFSAPRNLAIENAAGDWIIFLDADEFFIYPEKVRNAIENLLNENNIDAIFVMRIDIDEEKNNYEINRDWYIRIIRNVDYLRYRGIIHENIEHVRNEKILNAFANNDLLVYHTGYSTSLAKEKLQRNLSLIELEIKNFGIKDQHHIALVDCYFGLQDYEKVIYHSKKALTAKLKPITGLASLYRKLLNAMHNLNYPINEILKITDDAINAVPDNPEFYFTKGLILYFLKQYDSAYENLKKSIYTWHKMIEESGNENTYFTAFAEEVYVRLTELEAMAGNFTVAKENLSEAIKLAPNNQLYKTKYEELTKIEKSMRQA